jgi:hypothetical protein
VESEVREAYERLVAAFREGRWDDKFASFAEEATVVDGGRGSVPWASTVPRGTDGRNSGTSCQFPCRSIHALKLQMLGRAAV